MNHPYHLMLLTNLTRNDKNDAASKMLCQFDSPKKGQWLASLVNWFSRVPADQSPENDHLAYVAHILTNITQHECGRLMFYNTEHALFKKLAPMLLTGSSIRRLGVLRAIRNCLIDSATVGEYRFTFIIQECGVYPNLMVPIVGPGEIDEEDRSKMPPVIQEYLTKDPPSVRDEDVEVRAAVLDIILCCARNKNTRVFLRQRNTYQLIRELHNEEKKLERERFNEFIEDLVGFFILDEDVETKGPADEKAIEGPKIEEVEEEEERKEEESDEEEEESDDPEDAGDLDDVS